MKVAYVLDRFMIGGGLYFIYRLAPKAANVKFGLFGKGEENPLINELRTMENVEVFDSDFSFQYIKKEFAPDVIHVNHLKPLLKILGSPLGKPPVPIIYTARGLHVRKYKFMGGAVNGMKYILRKYLEIYLFRKVDRVVAVSMDDCGFLKSEYGLKNCVHIPNGIEIQETQIDISSIRKQLGLPIDKFLFVTVARFDFQKGYDILIQAIEMAKELLRKHNVKFVFVGDGKELWKIREWVNRSNINDLILFKGEVPNGEDYIKAADVMVLPSRWEGLPTVVIEAGMLKKPVIASLAPGTVDIIRHGITGIGFENENPEALARSFEDVLEGEYDIGEIATKLHEIAISSYNIDLTTEKYLNLYFELSSKAKN